MAGFPWLRYAHRQMLAMNDELLFGWSIAVIFEVLRKALTTIGTGEGDKERRRWPSDEVGSW
jgi:hypothetical protein